MVDLCNFVSFMNRNMSELLCGGRHRQYCEIFNKFFQSLKDAGAELVFFEDGAVQETKNEEWCKRQDSKYKNTMVHIKEIDCLERLEKVIQFSENKASPEIPRISTFLYALEICAETLGKLVRSVTVECDLEMAEYATKNDALAVLTDDTDFLIFPGNWFHWSVNEINETEMTTKKYDRKKLRMMLTLKDHQMPILATLAGNDIVPYECLKVNKNI